MGLGLEVDENHRVPGVPSSFGGSSGNNRRGIPRLKGQCLAKSTVRGMRGFYATSGETLNPTTQKL